MHVQRISYEDDDMDRFGTWCVCVYIYVCIYIYIYIKKNEKEKTSYELNATAKWRHVGYPEEHTVLLAIDMHAESAHAWRQDGRIRRLATSTCCWIRISYFPLARW
jgi:hypothetical protein